MNDLQVRIALRRQLRADHGDPPSTVILDELGLCQGRVRVDVALIDEHMHGYEIKADGDSLDRLPHQIALYGRVLEAATLVTTEHHLASATRLLPPWCGISIATAVHGAVVIDSFRSAEHHMETEAFSLVQLLWRDETLGHLASMGLAQGVQSKSRIVLWRLLAGSRPITFTMHGDSAIEMSVPIAIANSNMHFTSSMYETSNHCCRSARQLNAG